MRDLTALDLHRWRTHAPEAQWVDVREPWEFALCRIEGSRNLPLAQLAEGARELDPDVPVVMICHHGMRSLQAAYVLERTLGFAEVVNLRGGIDAWSLQVDPDVPRY